MNFNPILLLYYPLNEQLPKNHLSVKWFFYFSTFGYFKINVLKFTFNKKDKLKSKKLIEQLFSEGHTVSVYPLRLVYLKTAFDDGVLTKTGVSVSKRHFKKAVDRNRIKRLLREVYRLNKSVYFNNIPASYAFMILYIGNDKPTLAHVEEKMTLLFEKFLKTISKNITL